jgi:hypothetical protein
MATSNASYNSRTLCLAKQSLCHGILYDYVFSSFHTDNRALNYGPSRIYQSESITDQSDTDFHCHNLEIRQHVGNAAIYTDKSICLYYCYLCCVSPINYSINCYNHSMREKLGRYLEYHRCSLVLVSNGKKKVQKHTTAGIR